MTSSPHPPDAVLNDYVDVLLPADERRDVERHLADCAVCNRTVAELRSLIERAGALDEPQLSRDLLSGIREMIRKRRSARTRWMALAASLLILTTAAAGLLISGRSGDGGTAPAPVVASTATEEDLLAEFRQAERAFVEAGDALLAILERRREELPPAALATFERNLEILDAAIEEVRTTIGTDPVRSGNGQILTALHHKRMQLLWKASRLSS